MINHDYSLLPSQTVEIDGNCVNTLAATAQQTYLQPSFKSVYLLDDSTDLNGNKILSLDLKSGHLLKSGIDQLHKGILGLLTRRKKSTCSCSML